ncbi:MAG: hypothetical protein RMH74_04675 [Candidatus Caldarchaeum sp.]|nr:hypothetical protein [Candidatus Caldarchaeum sp.]MDW7978081.1 hypothetical protein [Candidatus Caldarchaeum sp.]
MIGKISPLLFGLIPLVFALLQVYYNPVQLDTAVYQKVLKQGDLYVVDLTFKPGDRYVVEFKTTGLSSLYVIEAKHYQLFLERGEPPSSAISFNMVAELNLALPSNAGGEYKLVVRQLRDGDVKLHVKPGTVDEAVGRLRRGEDVLRNSLEAEFPAGGVHVIPIYQFVMGTYVEINVLGAEKTLVATLAEYLAYQRGSKNLEALCVGSRCIQGSGTLKLVSEDYGDVYLLVQTSGSPANVKMKVVATPEMLLYVGTCG